MELGCEEIYRTAKTRLYFSYFLAFLVGLFVLSFYSHIGQIAYGYLYGIVSWLILMFLFWVIPSIVAI